MTESVTRDAAVATAAPRLIASTHPYPLREEWNARVDVVFVPGANRLERLRSILRAARDHRVLILDGSVSPPKSPDMMASLLLRLRRNRPAVVLTECNWKSGSGLEHVLRKIGMRLMDPVVSSYGVYTVAETRDFAARWGVSPAKLRFTPYYYNLTDEQLAWEPKPYVPGGTVFAGGNSLRDYPTLVEAARGLSVPVRIATTKDVPGPAAPEHVTIAPMAHDDFMRAMYEAAVNVVPMLPGLERCAGLETFVTAMAMGKCVIISDTPGVRDYVEHERNGLIVPAGNAGALREAIRWATDPANADAVGAMALAARADARERFSPEQYVGELLDEADRALKRTAGR